MTVVAEEPTVDFLLALFECPACNVHAQPPIQQCSRGHFACADCWARLTRCPICRGPRRENNNLLADKIAQRLRFPCRFKSYGCPEQLGVEDKRRHEGVCSCRSYACPRPGGHCKWEGTLNTVWGHLTQEHKNMRVFWGARVVFGLARATNEAQSWVQLMIAYARCFIVIATKDDVGAIKLSVRIIGIQEDADSFKVTFQLGLEGDRVLWEGKPRSFNDSARRRDFLIDSDTANYFTDNGVLPVVLTIAAIINLD